MKLIKETLSYAHLRRCKYEGPLRDEMKPQTQESEFPVEP